MAEESKTIEAAMARLEEIVGLLEGGQLPMEEALRLFEEGTGLVQSGSRLLDEAQLQVAKLMKGPDGVPVETEFESDV